MITAVVLAAGGGERFGGPKALAGVGARSLVEIVLETCARSVADEIVVVTGASAAEAGERVAAAAARHPDVAIRCVENARWREGRTGSLQAGVAACAERSAILVFPVDHPAVRLTTLDVLLGVFGYAAGEPDVVVPVVEIDGRRRRGHPIVLASRLRAEILALGPDQPLHDVVHSHDVLEVPVDDPGIILDVDRPDDLARAAALLGLN